jgi:hypothetical protein
LAHHDRGLVHDDRGQPFIERQMLPHQIGLERLAADRGGGRGEVDRLASQPRAHEDREGHDGARKEDAPAQTIENDGETERGQDEDGEPPAQRVEGLPHALRPQIPHEPQNEGRAGQKQERALPPSAHP